MVNLIEFNGFGVVICENSEHCSKSYTCIRVTDEK